MPTVGVTTLLFLQRGPQAMARHSIRFTHAFFLPIASSFRQPAWQPSADVYHTRQGWLLKFDLAGVHREDIELTVQGRRLTVRGTRRDHCTGEGCSCYRMEIAYSHFERSIDLPFELDPTRITVDYRDGMLLVRIPEEGDR